MHNFQIHPFCRLGRLQEIDIFHAQEVVRLRSDEWQGGRGSARTPGRKAAPRAAIILLSCPQHNCLVLTWVAVDNEWVFGFKCLWAVEVTLISSSRTHRHHQTLISRALKEPTSPTVRCSKESQNVPWRKRALPYLGRSNLLCSLESHPV